LQNNHHFMEIGQKLFNFSLKDINNNKITNYDFADKYALVLLITCNHCPYAQAYWHRLIKLYSKYEDDSLALIAINPNDASQYPQDSLENMRKFAEQKNLPFPYLVDDSQEVAKKLNASKTPEVFVFNSKRELVYKGAIDDNWEKEDLVTWYYLEDAIEDALDGMDVDFPFIEPVGCSIKWKKE